MMTNKKPNTPQLETVVSPNFLSFVLTIFIITSAFIGVFLFAFPSPLGTYLAASVGIVTVVTALIGTALKTNGHFDKAEELHEQNETTIQNPE